jgi:protein-S-isoprenylcysteine O-methyltransferase Ste14
LKLFSNVRGRVARPASVGWNVAKTLAQSLTLWAIFLFLLPAAVYYLEGSLGLAGYRFGSPLWQVAGVTLFMLGWILAYTSAAFMVVKGRGTPLPADSARKLVVAGPYRYVRNPMAMGSFAQGVAVGLFLGSPMVTLYALIGSVGWNYFVRPWEEMDLARRFGTEYVRYRDAVRCWIPRLRGYEPETRGEGAGRG